MKKFIPNMYYKDIFTINYEKLKQNNIKVLLYDFDNTIIEKGKDKVSDKTIELINKQKDDFFIYIVSNSINEKKLRSVAKQLDIPYIGNSQKPFKKGFKKLFFKSIENKQIAMIGDQLITDVFGGNRMGYCTILIDPISKKEHVWTSFNRIFEKKICKTNNLKRGKYYEQIL